MFTTSVSAVKEFWSDPFTWYVQYVIGRTTRRKPVALVAGIIWHEFMESLLMGGNRVLLLAIMRDKFITHIAAAEDEGLASRATDLRREMNVLLVAGELWRDSFDVSTLAVEEALSAEVILPSGVAAKLVGRPDRIVQFGGRLGHFQHRTLAATKPIDKYLSVFHRNPHEVAYWKMAELKYNEQPFGTLLSVVRKVTPAKMVENPGAALQQHVIPISREQANEGWVNLLATVDMMRRVAQGDLPLWFNPDRDLGQFGNSLSPYVRTWMESKYDGFADDEMYMDTPDRYTDLEVKS